MQTYSLTMLGTLAGLLIYVWATTGVGKARGKYGVKAPATTGHPDFERAFRAHQNTLEQLVLFLPLAWIVAILFGDVWGGVYAVVWVVGRIIYVRGYTAASEKRAAGFMISILATLAALAGSIVNVIFNMIR